MSEEPGVSSSDIRSTTSWGISMRSRAAFALSGDDTGGVVSTICLPGARRLEGVGGDCSGIDTTVQRSASPSFCSHTGNHMRSQRLLRILHPDRHASSLFLAGFLFGMLALTFLEFLLPMPDVKVAL